MVFQINGKLRDKIEIAVGESKDKLEAMSDRFVLKFVKP